MDRSHWEKASEQTQDLLEGFYPLAGVATPRCPFRKGGGSGQGEKGLGISVKTAPVAWF